MVKPITLKSGKEENKSFRRCTQTQCSFYIEGGCKACDECKSEGYILKKSCDRCYRCENVPNSLRWEDELTKAAMHAQRTAQTTPPEIDIILEAMQAAITPPDQEGIYIIHKNKK